MDRDDRGQVISRRTLLLGGAKVALTALIVGRMYYLQVIEAKKYRLMADKNRLTWRFRSSPRGRLLDRHGKEIASTQSAFHLAMAQEARPQLDSILAVLKPIISLPEDIYDRLKRDLKRNPSFVPTLIKDNLTWQEVTHFELHASDLPGVYIQPGQKRVYHEGPLYASVTGYVAMPSKKDVEDTPLLRIPDVRIGQQGLEKIYQEALCGEPAYDQLEVNAHNRVVRKLSENPGRSGQDLMLTIDHRIQQKCWEELQNFQAGSCIVLDIHTGAVRALVSHPSYDPNTFVDGISTELWHALQHNPHHPLQNRPISALYPPASPFKPIVALAGLEAGIIRPDVRVTCTGEFLLGSHLFHCWHKSGHGSVNLVQALAHSCDIYFYEMALKIGVDRIVEMATRFGFGEATGIDLPNEKKGNLPDRSWKRLVHKQSWYKGDTVNMSIGQGFLTATPLQLACFTAALANGGHRVSPYLLHDTQPALWSTACHPDHLALIAAGMEAAVHMPGGTSYTAAQQFLGPFRAAGKTGSAQVKRITLEERRLNLHKNAHRAWLYRDHAIFVGFGPFEAPRYALSLVLDHAGGGSLMAAPAGCRLLNHLFQLSE